jgi:EAL domain-containing protein (putative c-di-GMP-specific phosphodiesterase class I)
MNHPDHGVLRPEQFLPGLTDRQIAEELCLWTVTRACEALARWNAGGAVFAVVVNVSEAQLTPALPVVVRTALARSGARADLLTLEVDGSSAGRIDADQIGVLNEVRATGARIGIDRFGSEFRSIDTLLKLPVDVVKFDRSVFGGGALQPLERRMVDTVVALARAFGFEVIATGIETPAQLDLQEQFGCHGAQGYLLGMPVPEPEFRQLLNVA